MTAGPNTKYTVVLTPATRAALQETAVTNHESRTVILNRGVMLYQLVTQLRDQGFILVARNADGDEQRINII